MISDNFVVGDNVYLNELKNFFFKVLGMMSITHYGCIGDGRYDNYGPLQVAIDDANRRHLNYLYVPYGRFRFRGELINRDDIVFIGNPRAKIYNDRTGEEIEIKQFGVPKGIEVYYGSRAVMSAELSEAWMVQSNPDTIYFAGSTSAGDLSSALSLADGAIVIGEGVQKVKVSATVNFIPTRVDENYRNIELMKNNRIVATAYGRMEADDIGQTRTLSVSDRVIDVAEGDTIRIDTNNFAVGEEVASIGTYLTVEVVEYEGETNADESTDWTIGDNTPDPQPDDIDFTIGN